MDSPLKNNDSQGKVVFFFKSQMLKIMGNILLAVMPMAWFANSADRKAYHIVLMRPTYKSVFQKWELIEQAITS